MSSVPENKVNSTSTSPGASFPRTLPPAPVAAGPKSILRALTAARQQGSISDALIDAVEANFPGRAARIYGSGTQALYAFLCALRKHSDRRYVAIAAYTCPEIAAAVVRGGFHAALLDLESNSAAASDRSPVAWSDVAAVVLSNLYGIPESNSRWEKLAAEHGLVVIDDACQAALSLDWQGRVGSRGHSVGLLSFGRGKALSGIGGGALLIPQGSPLDAAVLNSIEMLSPFNASWWRDFGYGAAMWMFANPYLYTVPAKLPFLKLGETHCNLNFSLGPRSAVSLAFALARIRELEEYSKEQQECATAWTKYVPENMRIALSGAAEATVIPIRIPILCRNGTARDKALSRLIAAGLGATASYPKTLADYPELKPALAAGELPNARSFSERIITLPVHRFVSTEDQRRTAEILQECNAE